MNQAPVGEQEEQEAEAKRTLAYEQAISSQPSKAEDADEKDAETAEDGEKSGEKGIPDFDTVTNEAARDDANKPQDIQDLLPDEAMPPDEETPQDLAALPGESAPAPDTAALPPMPGEPGSEQWGTDGAEQWGDERPQQDPYATQGDPYGAPSADRSARQADPYGAPPGAPYDPYAPDPYAAQGDPYGAQPRDPSVPRRYGNLNGDPYAAQRDPYGQQADPYAQGDPYAAQQQQPWGTDQNGEEWVQVIVSGTGMRATASEEAPILFAFPYGRNLKVVSRNEGWVEVTDPNSSATGWMQAHALGPSSMNQNNYGQGQAYYEPEQPEERRGIFRDIINRAFGGGN